MSMQQQTGVKKLSYLVSSSSQTISIVLESNDAISLQDKSDNRKAKLWNLPSIGMPSLSFFQCKL